MSPLMVVHDGHFSVRVFFVLSGFVLALSVFRKGSSLPLGLAALRRTIRLGLPVAVSVLLAFAIHAAGGMPTREAAETIDSNPWLLNQYSFAPDGWAAIWQGTFGALLDLRKASTPYNSVLWTMSYEFFGSLMVFGFMALFGAHPRRRLLWVGLAAALLLLKQAYFLDFVVGMGLSDLYYHTGRAGKRPVLPGAVACGMVLAALFLGGFRNIWLQEAFPALGFIGEKGMRWWDSMGATLLITACLFTPTLQRQLVSNALTRLGTLSFPLYLCHFSLLCSLGLQSFLIARSSLGLGHHPAAAIASVVTVFVSLACSHVLYHIADRPAIWLGRKLASRHAPRRSAQAGDPAVVPVREIAV